MMPRRRRQQRSDRIGQERSQRKAVDRPSLDSRDGLFALSCAPYHPIIARQSGSETVAFGFGCVYIRIP
jgi:hypothetical protein